MKQRELKFRAWDIANNCWKDIEEIVIARNDLPTAIKATDGRTYQIQSNGQIVLSQYTGLKDKNGKEIYEGDIVQTQGIDNWEVIFHKGTFCYQTGEKEYHIFDERRTEVIGNIYENPELLK